MTMDAAPPIPIPPPPDPAGAPEPLPPPPARAGSPLPVSGAVVAAACFFLSGFSALVFEVIWMRRLHLVLGSTGFAVATVVAAYMGGLALGSWLGGRVADRLRRPLLVYGLLELGVGLYALLVPSIFDGAVPIYRWLWETFHLSFYPFSLFRFALAVLILLVPTTFMGATLPLMSRYIVRDRTRIGPAVGLLYALNTSGAVAGSFVSGFLILPMLGEWRGLLAAATGNGVIAVAIIVHSLLRRSEIVEPAATGPAGEPDPAPWAAAFTPAQRLLARRVVLAAFAVSGIASLTMQIAWTRLLSLLLGSSVYAFSIILTTFLLGLAAGSFAATRLAGRVKRPLAWLGGAQALTGVAALVGVFATNVLFFVFVLVFNRFDLRASARNLFLAEFFMAAVVIFLPTFFMGAAFPLGVRTWAQGLGALGRRVGELYSVNTVGAIVGSFLGGFVFLPSLGLQRSIEVAVVAYFLSAAALWVAASPSAPGLRWAALALAAAGAPAALFLAPRADPHILSTGVYKYATHYEHAKSWREFRRAASSRTRRVVFYEEGITTTVSVVRFRRQVSVSVNGKVDGSSVGDMPTQVLSGHLPLLFADRAEKVLVVGYGTGVTVGSMTCHDGVHVTCVELEGAVVEAGRYFKHVNHDTEDLVARGRVKIARNDGRNLLLASPETWDVIVSEPSNPWISGSSKLFTRDFFRLARDRLEDGGVFGQWVQLYGMDALNVRSLLRTFRDVFGSVAIFQPSPCADLLLVARRNAPLEIPRERLEAFFRHPAVAADLARIQVESPAALMAYFLADDAQVERFVASGAGAPPPLNTDDNSFIEFSAPRTLFVRDQATALQEALETGFAGPRTLLRGYPGAEGAAFLARIGERAMDLRPPLGRALCDLSLASAPTADGWAFRAILDWRKDRPAARRALDRATALDPRHRLALMRRATMELDDGRPARAALLFARILDHDEGDAEACYRYGIACYMLGRSLDRAHGEDLPFPPWPGPLTPRLFAYSQAFSALARVTGSTRPLRDHDQIHYYLACTRRALGDPIGAVAAYRTHIAWSPSDALARQSLAQLLEELGRPEEAAVERGPLHDPEKAKVLWNRARDLFAAGTAGEAVETALAAVDLSPYDEEIPMAAGSVLFSMGRNEEAAEAWGRGVTFLPGQRDMAASLAFLAEFLGLRALDPAEKRRWFLTSGRVLEALALRERDPGYRTEFQHRADVMAILAEDPGDEATPIR